MRNSNQQSFSVSIRSKREQLRNQIRRDQIQQIFKAKRLQLFHERQKDEKFQIYNELNQKIEDCSNDSRQVESLVEQIKQMYRKFPSQIWNFVLIGNFLLKRSDKAFDFEGLILSEESLIFTLVKEFAWCFGIYITIVCSLPQADKEKTDYSSLMQNAQMFMGFLFERYWKSFQLSEQSIASMEIYIHCFSNILSSVEKQAFFPINTFNSFLANIQQFYSTISVQQKIFVRNMKVQITQLINNILYQIKLKELYSSEIREFSNEQQQKFIISTTSMEKFMNFAAEVFFQNIIDASDERIICIESIKTLCECNPIAAGEFLFTKKNVKEFQYLMLNHSPKIRQLLLRSFNSILPSIINSKLIQFLDQSFHINLTHLLKRALQELHQKENIDKKFSDFLFFTLKVIETLLQKVELLDPLILQSVLNKMNMNNFADLIEKMGEERYDGRIEQIWSNIVDCHFSEDMCEDENQSNRQYQGDYTNQVHHPTYHYQNDKQKNFLNKEQTNAKRTIYENEDQII